MKKVAILFLLSLFPIFVLPQGSPERSFNAGDVTGTDSTYWTRVRGSSPVAIIWDFSLLTTNTALAWVLYGRLDSDGNIVTAKADNLNIDPSDYPLTLSKADTSYRNIVNGDTTYTFGIYSENWLYDYVGFKLKPQTADSIIKQHVIR